jgi:hypothetical protein
MFAVSPLEASTGSHHIAGMEFKKPAAVIFARALATRAVGASYPIRVMMVRRRDNRLVQG